MCIHKDSIKIGVQSSGVTNDQIIFELVMRFFASLCSALNDSCMNFENPTISDQKKFLIRQKGSDSNLYFAGLISC